MKRSSHPALQRRLIECKLEMKSTITSASHRATQILFVAASLTAACCFAFSQQPPAPSKSASQRPTVRLSLIVTDRSNHAVDDLNKDEIQVVEDKIPQTISVFGRDERPVDYGLAIDASGSLRKVLGSVVAAAKSIVNNNRDGDEIFIERFIDHDKIETMQEFTSDKAVLVKSLDQIYVEGGQSAVVDGVYLAVKHIAEHRLGPDRRHALILLTDGEDRQSFYNQSQLLQLIRERDVQVFAIGIVGQLDNQSGKNRLSQREKAENLLRTVARETGGRVFFPNNMTELGQAVAEIVHDLHRQYTIGYQSTGNDSKENFRTVEAKITEAPGREKLAAVTRAGYFVNPPTSSGEETDKKKKKQPE
jgi:Ca-activated chloride channel homolog